MTDNMEKKDTLVAQDAESAKTAVPKKTAPKKTAQKKPAPKSETLVYIGPNLLGGQLSAYTTFKNGACPHHVQMLKQKHQEIEKLMVPVSRLAQARQSLAGHGKEAQAYRELKRKFNQ